MAKYPLTEMAVKMFCPGNVVQQDDAGLPSILVWIPKFKNSDVLTGGNDSTHPAFIVNGKEIDGFYYSKYQNVVYNGKAYSLPAEDPQANVNFDTAREYCEDKGYGWHMSTAAEWAAIALWCKKNGFLPYGNNNNGKDTRESNYKAIQTFHKADGAIGRIATGTGPLTWSHNNAPDGIWDMNGNVLEWQGGLRIVWGEIQILANNDAADPDNPQNATSACWKAINAADGSLVEPESMTTDTAVKTSGSTVKLDYVDDVWTYSSGISNASAAGRACAFGSAACADEISEAAKVLLRALALLPDTDATADEYEGDSMWWINNAAERYVFRGGNCGNKVSAGVFFMTVDSRYASSEFGGFRAAYIPNI
jgi:hypothetical protein